MGRMQVDVNGQRLWFDVEGLALVISSLTSHGSRT